jgi:hypothetical protein
MLNFTSFLESRDEDLWWNYLDVIFERNEDEIANIQVKDGNWGKNDNGNVVYRFNIEGDNCAGANPYKGSEPCYVVTFAGDDLNPNVGVSVSFSRAQSYGDYRGGFGPKVFDAVRKAIYEYIKMRNPAALYWNPVQRDSEAEPGKANTPNARQGAYEIWSVKALWPEKYVSFRENEWLRRDLYDKFYVSKGFPKVPDNLDKNSLPGDKRKALRAFRQQVEHPDVQAKNREVQQDLHQHIAQITQERKKKLLNDPEQNPHGLKKGDSVYIDDAEALTNSATATRILPPWRVNQLRQHIEKGTSFGSLENIEYQEDKDILFGHVKFDDASFRIALRDLKKESESSVNARIAAKAATFDKLMNDPNFNPQKLAKGDKIIYIEPQDIRYPNNGTVGVITNINYSEIHNELIADVDWLPDEALWPQVSQLRLMDVPLNSKSIWKHTPENVASLKMRNEEAKRRAQAGQSGVEAQSQNKLSVPNTQTHNLGDSVRVGAGPLRGQTGVIDNFRMHNNTTYAILRSARGPIEVEVSLLSPQES